MNPLFWRSLSEGFQAFVPIALYLAWANRNGSRQQVRNIRWGVVLALPATIVAGLFFQSSTRQSLWEVGFAVAALPPAVWLAVVAWRRRAAPIESEPGDWPHPVTWTFTAIVIVRQAMLIFAVLTAALALGSFEATSAIVGGAATALTIVIVATILARLGSSETVRNAARAGSAIFVAEVALYAVHKAAESRLLPWSEPIETATEPFGPDGLYGLYISYVLCAAPIVIALLTAIAARPDIAIDQRRRSLGRGMAVAGIAITTLAVLAGIIAVRWGNDAARLPATGGVASMPADVPALNASPHLLFRHVALRDQAYGRLAIASLDTPATKRATLPFSCDRVSFSASAGICLQSERKVFSRYTAVLLDASLEPRLTFKLEGPPSRTRVSDDGRIGAITVFVTGAAHGYIGGSFSTKTTIIDMMSGDELGELEQFATWKDGARFKAADFNFWGVTFARDDNVFYATLKSNQKTYLVKGELALRKLTVLRENLECPSLSPDNRHIAFKKRVAADPAPWRFYVLDLVTMTEHPITGESRSVDDQIQWLDDGHVLYGVPRPNQPAVRDVWVAAIDGDAPARVFLPEAESPIVVRGTGR